MFDNKYTEVLKQQQRRNPLNKRPPKPSYCLGCGVLIEKELKTRRRRWCDNCSQKNRLIHINSFSLRKKNKEFREKNAPFFNRVFHAGDTMPCYKCGKPLVYDGVAEHLICEDCKGTEIPLNEAYVSLDSQTGFLFNKDGNRPLNQRQIQAILQELFETDSKCTVCVNSLNEYLFKVLVQFPKEERPFYADGDKIFCPDCGKPTVFQNSFAESLCEECKKIKEIELNKKTIIVDARPRKSIINEIISFEAYQKLKTVAEENNLSVNMLCRMIVSINKKEEPLS